MRSFITAYAAMNALGNNLDEIWVNWQQGVAPGMQKTQAYRPGAACYLGQVTADLPELEEKFSLYRCRNNRLLQACAEQLQAHINRLKQQYGKSRIAVVLGTSTSGIENSEDGIKAWLTTGERPDWYHYKQQYMGAAAEFLRQYLELEGPGFVVSTACTSSANAFASAQRLLQLNLCDAVIVGGVDTLCQMTVQGFTALASVSDELCQPFSKNRCGINIGEAAALLVLEKQPMDQNSLELYSVGCSSDAHHMSAPDPSAAGAIRSIQQALDNSPWQASDIDYINLHGTATPLNDAMESKAVAHIFGQDVHCSSTKSLIGHTLGAAAASEAVFCCLLLQRSQGLIPKQVWDGELDPEIAAITIADGQKPLDKLQLCLSNSFAFGGSNVSVLLGLQNEYCKA